MPGEPSFEIIRLPNKLARKVSRTGGPSLDKIIETAEADLEKLKEQHEAWLRQDLDRLERLLQRADEATAPSTAVVREIYGVSYEIKGHGANYEFPLIGRIAESLCSLIPDASQMTPNRLHLLRLHLDGMRAVLHDGIRSAEDGPAEELTAMLKAAVQKARAE